ncbi:hypothetical protein A3759_18035 [Thalassolituus sp. HI0120]|nr:hypothetical protein A3759_18035 [Thalassolituus sp. HI0120]
MGNDFTWKGFITDTLAAGATASLGEITKDIGFADGVTDVLGDAGFSVTMTAANQFVSETIRRNTFGSYDAHKETGLNFIERTLQSSGLKAAKTAGEALGQQALRGIFGDDKADKYFGDYEDSRKQSSLLERVYDLSDDYFTEKQPANSLEANQMTSQAALKQPDNRVANVSDNNQVRQQIALQNAYLNGNLGLAEDIRLDGRSSGEMSTDFVDLDSVAEPYEYEGLTPEEVAARSEAGLREAIAYSEAEYQDESDNSAQSQGSVTGQQIRYPGMTPIDLNAPLGDQYNEPVPVNTDIDVRAAIALSSETRMNESLGAIGENFVNGSSYLDSLGVNTESPELNFGLEVPGLADYGLEKYSDLSFGEALGNSFDNFVDSISYAWNNPGEVAEAAITGVANFANDVSKYGVLGKIALGQVESATEVAGYGLRIHSAYQQGDTNYLTQEAADFTFGLGTSLLGGEQRL